MLSDSQEKGGCVDYRAKWLACYGEHGKNWNPVSPHTDNLRATGQNNYRWHDFGYPQQASAKNSWGWEGLSC